MIVYAIACGFDWTGDKDRDTERSETKSDRALAVVSAHGKGIANRGIVANLFPKDIEQSNSVFS